MRIGISPYPASNTLAIREKLLALKPQIVRLTVEALSTWTPSWVINRVKEIRAIVPDCKVHLLLQERAVPTNLSKWLTDFAARATTLRGYVYAYTLGNELGALKYWSGPRESYVPFFRAFSAALDDADPDALIGAAGQTRGEIMGPRQNEWIAAIDDWVSFYDVHLEGPPGTFAEPIERMRKLTSYAPLWVTELTGTLGAPLTQQAKEIPLIFAEAEKAGAVCASYLPGDSRTVYGRWQPNALLTATGKERTTYGVVKKLIAEARAN